MPDCRAVGWPATRHTATTHLATQLSTLRPSHALEVARSHQVDTSLGIHHTGPSANPRARSHTSVLIGAPTSVGTPAPAGPGSTATVHPACAGKRHPYRRPSPPGPDHPRMRGEELTRRSPSSHSAGSPPHARGREHHNGKLLGLHRITPAYAGKSWPWCEYNLFGDKQTYHVPPVDLPGVTEFSWTL
jgi:Domain of unknown function (DUF2825).